MNKPNKKLVLAPLAALLLSACGSLDIGDLNDPGLDVFQTNPTPASVAAGCVGLLIEMRDDMPPTTATSRISASWDASRTTSTAPTRASSPSCSRVAQPGQPGVRGQLLGEPLQEHPRRQHPAGRHRRRGRAGGRRRRRRCGAGPRR